MQFIIIPTCGQQFDITSERTIMVKPFNEANLSRSIEFASGKVCNEQTNDYTNST